MSAAPEPEPQLTPEEVNRNKVHEICAPFILDNDTLRKIKDLFLQEIKMGLCKSTNPRAVVKCWITYVQSLPTGCETGKFLALDLGGTNFRVLLIQLEGANKFEQESQIFEIPDHILVGPGKDLFDHIADCLARFLKSMNLSDSEEFPLGFTFSFPDVRQ
ncbi:hypothetical protein DOY81_001827 [Sarcophaga bullata]|nr:hypothetical protein DOY81_001827 [Sarcophaga bullata]